jgi:glycosyltransferase involved in cell wall biosynthesis
MTKVCFPFVGDSIGGSHISALTLVNYLYNHKTDVKVCVLVFSASEKFTEYLLDNKISYIELEIKLNKYSKVNIILDAFRFLFKVVKFLKKEKIDIVHSNDLRMHLIFLLATKFSSTAQLWHQRTILPKSYFGQKFFLMSDEFIVISDFILKKISSKLSSNKIKRVYNPVESNLLSKKELSSKLKLFKKQCNILYVANMTKQKKPEFFVNLARHLTITKPEKYSFTMIGRVSPDIKKMTQQYRNNSTLGESFELLGFKDNINEYLKNASFLIVPAKDEGFGRTIVEAMRSGVFVIANDSGGHREIIENGKNGVLLNNMNIEAVISEVLKYSLNKNLYNEITMNAFNDVANKFSVKVHAKKILSIYHDMLRA